MSYTEIRLYAEQKIWEPVKFNDQPYLHHGKIYELLRPDFTTFLLVGEGKVSLLMERFIGYREFAVPDPKNTESSNFGNN